MRIDRTHRPWGIAAGTLAIAATVAYVFYAIETPGGPRGGSAIGLAFGGTGYGLMLYAGLLGARKKVPTWRLGRAQTWMRGHLWLGALSCLLILFHSGFRSRAPLTLALMIVLAIVAASGILGAALQHLLPGVLTARVPLETIYDEIPPVRAQLCEEADRLCAAICGTQEAASEHIANRHQNVLVEMGHDDGERFRELYQRKIRPYLANPDASNAELGNPRRADEIFGALRRVVSAPAQEALDDLEDICEEGRQLSRQIRLHRWLHAWLLVHAPLSILLLLLA